jgi:PLP dependent protein
MVDIAANHRKIIDRIGDAATRAGRDPRAVKLLAAAKSQSVELVQAAVAAGVWLIGDNYVQEAEAKRRWISQPVEWHMIGHLQRNKVKSALRTFDLIQSLDSVALARDLDKEGDRLGRKIRTFIEVNLGEEESKSGIARSKVAELVKRVSDLSHLRVEGLMAVPPFRENPEEVRPFFSALKALQSELQCFDIPNVAVDELSMGMTHDYAVAIEEGATIVRIGTALFGAREK